MRQKSGPEKQPAEDAIRDIRRATRRHFSAEEKIRVVLEGLRGEESIAELCRREGIASSMYYGWSKEFLEAGKRRLAGDTARAATSDEVKDLRREAQALKEVVADLTLENRLLKKSMIAVWGLVEQSHLPARRTLDKLGVPRSSFYRWYDRHQRGGPEALADRPSRPDRVWNRIPRLSAARLSTWRNGSAGTEPAGTGGALHGRDRILCLGGLGLSAAESARSYHQPGLHRHQSGRGVQGQDHGAQPALADRFHLSQDHGLGLVLSLHRAGRLLALHCRLEALCDHEGEGRHRHPRSGAIRVWARQDDRRSPTAFAVG